MNTLQRGQHFIERDINDCATYSVCFPVEMHGLPLTSRTISGTLAAVSCNLPLSPSTDVLKSKLCCDENTLRLRTHAQTS